MDADELLFESSVPIIASEISMAELIPPSTTNDIHSNGISTTTAAPPSISAVSAKGTSHTLPVLAASDEAQVSWSALAIESLPFNNVFDAHSYMDMGAPNDGISKSVRIPHTDRFDEYMQDWTDAPGQEELSMRVGASLISACSPLHCPSSKASASGMHQFLSHCAHRGHVIHTSLQSLKHLQAKIFNATAPHKNKAKSTALMESVGEKENKEKINSYANSLFSCSADSSHSGAVQLSARSSSNSPTLRLLVASFFPMFEFAAQREPTLNHSLLTSLLNVMHTLPPLALQTEPDECMQKFKQIILNQINSTDSHSSASVRGTALSALIALALQRGRLHGILEAVTTCLHATSPLKYSNVPTCSNSSNGGTKSLPADVNETDILLSVDPFLHQLSVYRAEENIPQMTSQTFVAAWQHHPTDLSTHAPHKACIELPVEAATACTSPNSTVRVTSGSIASDGRFLYLHSSLCGLIKVGSGNEGTLTGHVYANNPNFMQNQQSSHDPTGTSLKELSITDIGVDKSIGAKSVVSNPADMSGELNGVHLVWAHQRLFVTVSRSGGIDSCAFRMYEVNPISLQLMGDVSMEWDSAVPVKIAPVGSKKTKAHIVPHYAAVTSDGECLYGLHCGSTVRASTENTPGVCSCIDVWSIHPTDQRMIFQMTLQLDSTDGSGSDWESLPRSLLPPGVAVSLLGVQAALPFKLAVIGGGIASDASQTDGFILRMPSLPRMHSHTPTSFSFKPDIFDLRTGKCMQRGGWEQRIYDAPCSPLQANDCSLATAWMSAPRGTALCYCSRQNVLIEYTPLTLQLQFWRNSSTVRHAQWEDEAQRRLRKGPLAHMRVIKGGCATSLITQVLPVCSAILHHIARIAQTYVPSPAQLSLAGSSIGPLSVPLSPYSNLAVPNSLTATPIIGTDNGLLPGISPTQPLAVDLTSITFDLILRQLRMLLESLTSASAGKSSSVTVSAVYHALISVLQILSAQLSLLSPPPLSYTASKRGSVDHPLILTTSIAKQLKEQLLTLAIPNSGHPKIPSIDSAAASALNHHALTALLAGLPHFYYSGDEIAMLLSSSLGYSPAVVQTLVQFPRFCLLISDDRIQGELSENGTVTSLIRRVMEESMQSIQLISGTDSSPNSNSHPSLSIEAPLLSPALQLLRECHRSLLSRINSSHECVRSSILQYATRIIDSATQILRVCNSQGQWREAIDRSLQSSPVGLLLPSLISELRSSTISNNRTHLTDWITTVLGESANGTGALTDLLRELARYQQRSLVAMPTKHTSPGESVSIQRTQRVIECAHPYACGDGLDSSASFVPVRMPTQVFTFPKADYLCLQFDPRCSTAHRTDVLTIQSLAGRKLLTGIPAAKSTIHSTSQSANMYSTGTTLELSLNHFPKTPVVIPGDTLMLAWSPEGSIRDCERGTPSHAKEKKHSNKQRALFFGFKVTVMAVQLRRTSLTQLTHLNATARWTDELLHMVALLSGSCVALSPPIIDGFESQPISELLRSPLFAIGLQGDAASESVSNSTQSDRKCDGTSLMSPFVQQLLEGGSPASSLFSWMSTRVKSGIALSGVARKCLPNVERPILTALMHVTGITSIAQLAVEKIVSGQSESISPDTLNQLQQCWRASYPLIHSFLQRARTFKQYFDLLCSSNMHKEINEMDSKQSTELLQLPSFTITPDHRSDNTQMYLASSMVESSISSQLSPKAVSSVSSPQHESPLLLRAQQDRARLRAERQATMGQRTAKQQSALVPSVSPTGETATDVSEYSLELSWEDAYAAAAEQFIAGAMLLLQLQSPSAPILPANHFNSDALPLTRSVSLTRSSSAVQRQLLNEAEFELPSVGREVASRECSGTRANEFAIPHTTASSDGAISHMHGLSMPNSRDPLSSLSVNPNEYMQQQLTLAAGFLNSRVDSTAVRRVLSSRMLQAECRARQLRQLNTCILAIHEHCSNGSLTLSINPIHALILPFVHHMQEKWSYSADSSLDEIRMVPHFLTRLSGIGAQKEARLRSAFTELLTTVSSLLASPLLHTATRLILMQAVSLQYRPEDAGMLLSTKLLLHLHQQCAAVSAGNNDSAGSVVHYSRWLFTQLAKLVLFLPCNSDESSVHELQQQVIAFAFEQLSVLSRQQPSIPSERVEHEAALHCSVSLLHSIRHASSVQTAFGQHDHIQTVLSVLHMQIVGQHPRVHTYATASARTQQLLLRILIQAASRVGMLVGETVKSALAGPLCPPRHFVQAVLDRIAALISGSSMVESYTSTHVTESKQSEEKEQEEKKSIATIDPVASVSAPSPSRSPSNSVSDQLYSISLIRTQSDTLSGDEFISLISSACADILKGVALSVSDSNMNVPAVTSSECRAQLNSGSPAIISVGSRDECERIGQQISSRGFVTIIAPMPVSQVLVKNNELATLNPIGHVSGAAALALAADWVHLIHSLMSSPSWSSVVVNEMMERIKQLPMMSGANASVSDLSATIASLCVLGGVETDLCVGATVSVLPVSSISAGIIDSSSLISESNECFTVSEFQPGDSYALITRDSDGSKSSVRLPLNRILVTTPAFPIDATLSTDQLSQLQGKLVEFLQSMLGSEIQTQSTVSDDVRLLQNECVLQSLRVLTALASSKQAAANMFQTSPSLLSLLVHSSQQVSACSSGLEASQLHHRRCEQQVARLRRRWIDLRSQSHEVLLLSRLANSRAVSTGSKMDQQSAIGNNAARLPYQPHAAATQTTLPVEIDPNCGYAFLEWSKPVASELHGRSIESVQLLTFTRPASVSNPSSLSHVTSLISHSLFRSSLLPCDSVYLCVYADYIGYRSAEHWSTHWLGAILI
jgi:hypothetical protein